MLREGWSCHYGTNPRGQPPRFNYLIYVDTGSQDIILDVYMSNKAKSTANEGAISTLHRVVCLKPSR